MVANARVYFPDMPSKCPIKPGKYYYYNHTQTHDGMVQETGSFNPKDLFVLPNGLYRTSIGLYTKEDPNVFSYEFIIEVKKRLGDDRF
jgi:hypothetical protein